MKFGLKKNSRVCKKKWYLSNSCGSLWTFRKMRKLIDWQKRQQRKNTLTLKFCQRH